MIPSLEIKNAATASGVPITTTERDYAQNWLLKHLARSGLVLKGGTAIRKAYIPEYRYSDDIDFTLQNPLDDIALHRIFSDAIAKARDESGIMFSSDIRLVGNKNGFVGRVYFRMHRMTGTPVKIKIDVTGVEDEPILLPTRMVSVNHPYSDRCVVRMPVYSLEEIFSEKLRSLFQRTRPRDLYDANQLAHHVNANGLKDLVAEKFRAKKVSIDLGLFEKRRADFEKAWTASLAHQINPLPDVRSVLDEVEDILIVYE